MKIVTGKGPLIRKFILDNENNKNLLILPESNLDLNEQANFINSIDKNSDITIITMSPFIISDVDREFVYVINPKGELKLANFQTFGTSVNKITMMLFRRETIGQKALNKINEISNNVETYSIEDIDKILGESVEKMFLLRKLFALEDSLKKKLTKLIDKIRS